MASSDDCPVITNSPPLEIRGPDSFDNLVDVLPDLGVVYIIDRRRRTDQLVDGGQ
ncbi:MAG TPA: hypothetical protein VFR11_08265 [Micromonosporaceae bacterium]|jgi:hypothetical protein|nr:hypothetical protein [Micromonosporaceae bacterium]